MVFLSFLDEKLPFKENSTDIKFRLLGWKLRVSFLPTYLIEIELNEVSVNFKGTEIILKCKKSFTTSLQ